MGFSLNLLTQHFDIQKSPRRAKNGIKKVEYFMPSWEIQPNLYSNDQFQDQPRNLCRYLQVVVVKR
jgi:hypothetical protein